MLHPAASMLIHHAAKGCPTLTDQPQKIMEMQATVDQGPHVSALVPEIMQQLEHEVEEKVERGYAQVVLWDEIRDKPPLQLKISLFAMIPCKSLHLMPF